MGGDCSAGKSTAARDGSRGSMTDAAVSPEPALVTARRPSGDQAETDDGDSVSCRSSLPAGRIGHTCREPLRSENIAIDWPSGDQRGTRSIDGSDVSCRMAPEPSDFAIYRSPSGPTCE